jgi:tetratricopeptide (TPR) repeat protein
MGNIELKKRHIKNALEHFNKAQEIDGGKNVTLINKTLALISAGRFEYALKTILLFKKKGEEFSYENYRYYNLCGFILLRLQQPFKALPYFHKAMLAYPNDKKAVINYAVALSQTAQYDKAENMLNKVRKVFSFDIVSYFALIDNSVRQNNLDKVNFYRGILEENFSEPQIKSVLLADNFEKNCTVPFSSELYELLLDEKK